MTLGDVITQLNQNRELIATVLGTMIAAIFGKRRYDQAVASFEEKIAKGLAIVDGLIQQLVRADALTADAIERLDKEWKPLFEAAARALGWDVTPRDMAAIMERVRNHAVAAIAGYTKLRTELAVSSLETSAKRWDHAIDVVIPGHMKKVQEAVDRTTKRRAARAVKARKAKEKAIRREMDGG